ncbi:MAG TPA: hypothetical protein VGS58_15725, partial [Candidatus Sulfopaludibacter sp.]|nr:hypothetical protein [Candidatus Sulfopaludibacter sp.]
DLPRPEVLMNMWSLQASSPEGGDLARQNQIIRSAVSLHNDALQNAIEYGWAYLSREMKNKKDYFDPWFYSYLTERFVADTPACLENPKDPTCIPDGDKHKFGLCGTGEYCLGYVDAFKPLKPTLTNILLGLMAARDTFHAVFTTLGCMAGDYQQYSEDCFPERKKLQPRLAAQQTDGVCLQDRTRIELLVKRGASQSSAEKAAAESPMAPPPPPATAKTSAAKAIAQLPDPSCEDLDRAALAAQKFCGVTLSLPLTCFTEQAAKSFVPYHGFSTFTTQELMKLSGKRIADLKSLWDLPKNEENLSTTPVGLLRAATANFLFNYKMAMEFPREFSPYELSHSAQDLNAEFNPLVVAFNQDVSAFSRALMDLVQEQLNGNQWKGRNKSFVADGLVTVRGLSGLESLVDTDTQNAFNAPQFQTPAGVLGNLAGIAGGAPASSNGSTTTTSTSTTGPTPQPAPPSSNLTSILPSFLSRASFPAALAAAVLPTGAQVQIGRQLTLDITPHSLPGASSAELDVKLWAGEDSPPALYKDGGASPQTDPLSRIARHNVFTRVRVESVKLFEISSFSALVQRPRKKVPLLPPLVELPGINSVLGFPLPGAKVYHRSTAIVSAIVVPTAADLAFGIAYIRDRAAVSDNTYRTISSMFQLPRNEQRLYEFNRRKTRCLSTSAQNCAINFGDLPPDR